MERKQNSGFDKELTKKRECSSSADARQLFSDIRSRLLHINNWEMWNRNLPTSFQLHDAKGVVRSGAAQEGDRISIDIPGPGISIGNGRDWVAVEKREQSSNPMQDRFVLVLRPCSNPQSPDSHTAHFYPSGSSSTFELIRQDKTVFIQYKGENEKPNTETGNMADNLRNAGVAAAGLLGLSDLNWEGLLDGLISGEKNR